MTVTYELCHTEFWNINSTWYTDTPKFSPCFRNTALIWAPSCILLIASICEFFGIRQARLDKLTPIPWNYYNRFRILVTILLLLSKLGKIISNVYAFQAKGSWILDPNDGPIYQEGNNQIIDLSSFIAPIMQMLCYAILIAIYCFQRRAGVHTSGGVWSYLFIAILCGSLDTFSMIVTYNHDDNIVKLLLNYAHFLLLVLLFIIECRGDTAITRPDYTTDSRPESPEKRASYCSSITFWWFNSFLVFGYKSKIRLTDLWRTLPRDAASSIVPIFRDAWVKVKKCSPTKATYHSASGKVQRANNILLVLAKLFWARLLFAAFLKLMQDSLQYTTPMLLKKIIQFMGSNSPVWHGVLFAILLLIVPTIQSLLLGNYFYHMQVIGVQVRTMIIGSIYRKALLLSGNSRIQSTSGEIVNLMSVDSQRFQDLLMYINLFWSAPFQIGLAIFLLYRELGWSVFAGVICMALVLPCNAILANRIKMAQIKLMKKKDERIKQMNELLNGIKVIKLYAWENSFISNLFGFRGKELGFLTRILTFDAIQTFLWQCSPFVVSVVTFAVYVNASEENVLDAEKAFVSISLFNLLRFPLTMLPSLVTSLVLTIVSSKRLNRFLNSNELVRYITRNEELEAISIEGGTLSWSKDDTESESSTTNVVLRDIDFHVKPNSFVAIVGQVASGKSSLLSSILGEMHRITGRFNICKSMSMAYVPQQAWIQNMTVKENILFGSEYDEERYKQVLSVCSLQSDLETLPGGDDAEIGEKGINLSGGQKQRVSLARACYSNSDIYLFDDPLSALDSHVAKHVLTKVLSSSTGMLRNKTRVLATNSLFVLPHVDYVVVLDKGRIVESGSYDELMKIEGGHLAEWMRQYSGNKTESNEGADQMMENVAKKDSSSAIVGQKSIEQAVLSAAPAEKEVKSLKSEPLSAGKLTETERVETGSVNYSVYMRYFKAVSIIWLSAVSISLVASASFNVATNIWLSIWSSDSDAAKDGKDHELQTIRLIVYAILGGLQCFAVLAGSLALSRGAIRGARRLHANLLERVMHSPMSFFDTTPIGRIVNRFAKDIDVVDSTLPGAFRSWLACLLQVISTLFVICYSFPTFLIIIVPLAIVYFGIQRLFIVTTRQIKRLESITRSPIYSHFNETLSGIGTIRAYNCVDRFVNNSDSLVDRNQSCSYPNIIANRWLSIRLELFGNFITSAAALFSVYYRGQIAAGTAGLCISYSLSITQTLSWLVRMTSDLETNIVSVERILEYVQNKQEDLWVKQSRPAPEWPDKGAIQIEDFSVRYREDTDLVLSDISIDIKPGEKIGIVGRTGSGKSSLSLSLFRIIEPSAGRIMIDNLNLVDFGLHDIRSKLTIIPQDPVLFSGTLRFNLDPLELYSDDEIWRAIDLAHLKPHVCALKLGLDHKVSEFGENFSVGQRQLICLARAILRKSKILILDEATASVDLETDGIVQKTIRDIFSDCTIITIAHRLITILDSDRILVLDKGRVLELDSPERLILNPNSAFSSLVRDAGIETSSALRIASERRGGGSSSGFHGQISER